MQKSTSRELGENTYKRHHPQPNVREKNCMTTESIQVPVASSVHDDISRTDIDGIITLTFTQ